MASADAARAQVWSTGLRATVIFFVFFFAYVDSQSYGLEDLVVAIIRFALIQLKLSAAARYNCSSLRHTGAWQRRQEASQDRLSSSQASL